MSYTPLTQIGKSFIKNICKGDGKSLIEGKRNLVLPYCNPPISPDKIWTSNAVFVKNGVNIPITTNSILGDALIDWYDDYGKMFEMDANIVASQAFHESGYKIWVYNVASPENKSSTASGIGQFVLKTLYWCGIANNNSIDVVTNSTVTENEKIALTKNIPSNKARLETTYNINTDDGKLYRATIHQNIIDNPDIMIKLQFRYMKYIANQYSDLASVVLFGYYQGPAKCKQTYQDTIQAYKNNSDGIKYVYDVFKILYDKFGYKNLNMIYDDKYLASNFDPYKADVDRSVMYY